MRDEGRALVRAFRGPAEGWGHKLAEVFGSMGAFAPSGLSLATALASATDTSALTLLPALLSGFFGVCSPRGARAAETQLTLLAQELASARTQSDPDYFKREGALQLIRDFIPESARKESEEDCARLRRVLVQGARQAAPVDRTRTLFGMATRLGAAEVHLLRVLAAGHDEVTEPYPGARDVLIREGLVRARGAGQPADGAPAMQVTELGRQFLAWTAEPDSHDHPRLPAEAARPPFVSTR